MNYCVTIAQLLRHFPRPLLLRPQYPSLDCHIARYPSGMFCRSALLATPHRKRFVAIPSVSLVLLGHTNCNVSVSHNRSVKLPSFRHFQDQCPTTNRKKWAKQTGICFAGFGFYIARCGATRLSTTIEPKAVGAFQVLAMGCARCGAKPLLQAARNKDRKWASLSRATTGAQAAHFPHQHLLPDRALFPSYVLSFQEGKKYLQCEILIEDPLVLVRCRGPAEWAFQLRCHNLSSA